MKTKELRSNTFLSFTQPLIDSYYLENTPT